MPEIKNAATERALARLAESMNTLSHVQEYAHNIQASIAPALRDAGWDRREAELSQCRLTHVPEVEAARAVRATMVAILPRLRGTAYAALVEECLRHFEIWLYKHLRELVEMGFEMADDGLRSYEPLLPNGRDGRCLATIRRTDVCASLAHYFLFGETLLKDLRKYRATGAYRP